MLAHKQKPSQMSKYEVYVYQNASQIKEQLFRTVIKDPTPFGLFFVEDLYTIRILADSGDESLFD